MDEQLKEQRSKDQGKRYDNKLDEIISMLRELKGMNTSCLTEVPRRDLPKFEGINPRLWLRQCHKYFRVYNIPENQKMEVASLYMVGEPKVWMSSYMSIMKGADWTDVICCLVSKYRDKIGLDVEDKEFKKWEDSFENHRVECVGFMEKKYVQDDVVIDKKSVQDDVISYDFDDSFGLDGKSSELLPEVQLPVFSSLSGQLEKGEIDVEDEFEDLSKKCTEPVEKLLGDAEIDKEDVVAVVLDSADTSSEPASEDVSLGVNLFAQSEILGDARQVFDGNLDKGSMKDNTQSAVMHKEGQLCQSYQVLQFSGLEMSEKYGSCDSTSEKGWKVKITPWRDKSTVVGGLKGELAATAKNVIQGLTTELSSVGLVYKHFGLEIIAKEVQLDEIHPDVLRSSLAIYISLMEVFGVMDKGINQYDNESENGWTAKPIPWRDKNDRCVTYEVVQSAESVGMVVSSGLAIQGVLVDKEQSDQFYQVFDVRIAKNGDVRIAMNGALTAKQNDMIFVSILDNDSGKYNSQFENSWKMRPLPWRDKFVKSCLLAFEFIMKFMSNLGNMHWNCVSVNWITAWGLGISGSSLFCVFLGLFGYMYVKKWKGMRMDKSFKAERVTGPRQFSYKDLEVMDMDGSLRCLLKSVFNHGIPEGLVAIVLKEVLEVLANPHQQGHLHHKLKADHIYYEVGIPAIKFGFLATIYEHNSGDDGQAFPRNLHGMLALCLTEDAGERPTAAALLMQHDFFKICDAFSTFTTSGMLQRWLQLLSSVMAKDLRTSLLEGGKYDKGSQSLIK